MTSEKSGSDTPQRRQARAKSSNDGSISPTMAILSALSVILLVVILAVASTSDRVSKPQNINGDSLGPESWESVEAYKARADESMVLIQKEAQNLESKQPVVKHPEFWALVTFDKPRDASQAAELADRNPTLRVASMVFGGVIIRNLPQPSEAASEQRLLEDQLKIAAEYADVPVDDESLLINGFIVHGSVDALNDVRALPYVKVVQALPSDAERGRFGIRPFVGSEFTNADPLFAPGLSQN